MRAAAGDWLLIDWDMALIAPPERYLWHLGGDGAALAAYTEATSIMPVTGLMELYRFQWDVKDIAYGVSRFRRRHSGTAEDEKAWDGLSSLVRRVAQQSAHSLD
jgi:hypothetical protein